MVSTSNTRTIERGTYSAPEAFARLGVGRTLGYQMIRDGRLPALRFGRRVVVPVAAIERLLSDPKHIRTDAA